MRAGRHTLRACVSVVSVLSVTGCPMKVSLIIPSGSTISDLRFIIGRGPSDAAAELPMFVVRACSVRVSDPQDDYWLLEATQQATAVH